MKSKTALIIVVVFVIALFLFLHYRAASSPKVETNGYNLDDTPSTSDVTPAPSTDPVTTPSPTINNNQDKVMTATLHTTKGDITVEFYDKQAPNTVANFEKLAKAGFYNGIKFHRVIKDFMIQGGDPLTKDDSKEAMWGTGGPGYKFADEIDAKSDLYTTGYKKGILAMANSGPNTNGSQFFIMTTDYPLPPLYTIFGKVISGQDVVDAIGVTATDANDRPTTAVVINSVTLK